MADGKLGALGFFQEGRHTPITDDALSNPLPNWFANMVGGGSAGEGVGRASIAGTVVLFGTAGPNPGQWSKRGTIVALGSVTPPA